jgi:NACHT domain-containing protein
MLSSLSGECDLIGSHRWPQVWQSAIVERAKGPGRRHLRAAVHPTRRDGVIAIALLVLPWIVALVLVLRHHHLDGGAIGMLVAVSLGLPTLWVAWAAYRGPRRADTRTGGLTLDQVADQLAIAVGAQWEAEAALRRLNDPYPLPVSWGPADTSLTDSWDSLLKLATSGAGWPDPPPSGTWAPGPDDLAGKGGELAEVLARVPTGRLVVLGEPGAGKTMLMVRLVLDMLARRASGGPVPFLASVASWDPEKQELSNWLTTRLLIDHPALANTSAKGRTEPSQAAALLASGLILPVLDGLDEIPDRVRGAAISRINDALRPGEQVVVTCRTEQYRDAIRPPGGAEVTLRAVAAVQLHPLDADTVRGYLRDDAAGPAARTRWDPVLAVLGTEAPAGQALGTPLMVGLARAIYNPRPGELAGTLRDPAELCSPALARRAAVESLLFDAFIPAAYRHGSSGRWKAQDAERWLVFIARHLEQTIGSADLAWWQLQKAAPRTVLRIAVWLGAGLVLGLAAGLGFRFGFRLGLGFGFGLAAGFGFRRGDGSVGAPARGMRISVTGFTVGLAAAVLAVGLVLGAAAEAGPWAGIGAEAPPGAGPWAGLGVVLGVGLAVGLGVGLEGLPGDLAGVASPGAVLARDRQVALLRTLVAPLVLGLGVGLAVGFAAGREAGLGFGLGAGLGLGLVLNTDQTAWSAYMLTRGWLAFRRRLPWPLMRFLSDAHRRGVLRQVGAVYQFRHIELQHRLAKRNAGK